MTELVARDRPELVVSLDLDGTVWFGDPAGPIGEAFVTALREASIIVGSASDRTVRDQRRLWERAGIAPDFVVVKNHLRLVRPTYAASVFVHIGDRFADRLEADGAGAHFIDVNVAPQATWQDLERFRVVVREMFGDLEGRSG